MVAVLGDDVEAAVLYLQLRALLYPRRVGELRRLDPAWRPGPALAASELFVLDLGFRHGAVLDAFIHTIGRAGPDTLYAMGAASLAAADPRVEPR